MTYKFNIKIPIDSYVIALLSAVMVLLVVIYLAWQNRPINIDLDKNAVQQIQDIDKQFSNKANENTAIIDSRTIFSNIKERSPRILSEFKIISPQSQLICGAKDPWLLGEKVINRDDSLPSAGCFSIGIKLASDVSMYLFSHAEDGTLRLLYPNQNCSFLTSNTNTFSVNQMSYFPLNTKGEKIPLRLDTQSGREWVYAVGIYSRSVTEIFEKIIERVPRICGEKTILKVNVELFQSILKGLQSSTRKNLQWYSRSFLHQ